MDSKDPSASGLRPEEAPDLKIRRLISGVVDAVRHASMKTLGTFDLNLVEIETMTSQLVASMFNLSEVESRGEQQKDGTLRIIVVGKGAGNMRVELALETTK